MSGEPLAEVERIAVVTGADSGIGQATAVVLAEQGFDVGIAWQGDPDGAQQTVDEVRSLGRRVASAEHDLTRLPEAADVVDRLADELGGLGVLVNVAGTGSAEMALDVPYERWRQVLSVDLDGPFLLAQRAARRMVVAGRGGRIVNVTSVHEHAPRVGSAAYCAAKGGLGMLTKVLALELAVHGITVNAVAPGEIATPMTGQDDVDVRGVARHGVPLGRPGDAREVAAVISFLASPAASYVTGASYAVDGGMLGMGPHAGTAVPDDAWRTV